MATLKPNTPSTAEREWAPAEVFGVDAEADALAQEFLMSITSAEDAFEDARDEFVIEELGGPFVDGSEDDTDPDPASTGRRRSGAT